jgi:hypothetical protein
MTITIELPLADDGSRTAYTLGEPKKFPRHTVPFHSRIAFAAAHVTAASPTSVDWETTMAYRRHLWSHGFAVAEAMDTSQRGMGLDWPMAQELIRRSIAEAAAHGGTVASGAGTDHLSPRPDRSIDEVIAAYEEQVGYVEGLGGRVILMASRALAACAKGPDDYARVYERILSQVRRPVIVHWLGDMFDPQLAGYWGTRDLDAATESCLAILHAHAAKIDGIKISLLDDKREIAMRRRLPAGVRMYTGDDFNYPTLILGDEQGYSDALLGIFDAIAPAASAGLAALARGDMKKYSELMEPTVPLSRLIFRAPTQYYKTGIVFLAWLNGHQDHFVMVNGAQAMRPLPYFIEVFKLADQARLLSDPELAVKRMKTLLAMYGA